ncbi:hypothetical protein YC2023_119692 [Brassica napus]
MVEVSGETTGCNTSGGKYGGSDEMSARGGGDGGDASGETCNPTSDFGIVMSCNGYEGKDGGADGVVKIIIIRRSRYNLAKKRIRICKY